MLGTCIVLPWRGSAHIALLLPLQLYQLSVTLLSLLLLVFLQVLVLSALVLPWRVWLSLAIAIAHALILWCLCHTLFGHYCTTHPFCSNEYNVALSPASITHTTFTNACGVGASCRLHPLMLEPQ